MYVRELELRTGRTRTLLRPVDRHDRGVAYVLTPSVTYVLAPYTEGVSGASN
jgi:hypothetical protein